MLRGSPHLCQEARVACTGSPRGTSPVLLGWNPSPAGCPAALPAAWCLSNRKTAETVSFPPKKEQKVVVMVLGNNVKDVGEGLFSSLPRVCWAVAPVQLWSFGLLCVRSLPLRPSLCSHTKGKKLLLAPFFFISFCRFPSSPLLHHSAAHLLEQELSWLFLTCLWFSWETFSTFILQKRRKCFFYCFAEANHMRQQLRNILMQKPFSLQINCNILCSPQGNNAQKGDSESWHSCPAAFLMERHSSKRKIVATRRSQKSLTNLYFHQ